jgi:type IV pilus assembly protein PilO
MLFQEKQQLMICVVAGVVVCAFVAFWYLPLRQRMKAVEQVKAAQALAVAKGDAASKRLPALKEQVQQLRSRLRNYETKIPEPGALGTFVRGIADLMNEYNLQEQVITPGAEVQADRLVCTPVKMQCKGRLGQVFNFYQRLQSLDRLVRIEQVKLSNDRDYDGRVSMETRAVIYYRAKVRQG